MGKKTNTSRGGRKNEPMSNKNKQETIVEDKSILYAVIYFAVALLLILFFFLFY